MRAFITGISGFLGTALANWLVRDGHEIVGMVRDVGHDWEKPFGVTYAKADLSDVASLERVLGEYRIEAVIHLAAQTEIGVAYNDPLSTFESNVRGTWNVLEACRRQKVARVIVASSDKAYGRSKPPYEDGTEILPDRPYDTSKACADLIARTYASTYGMSVAVTRCTNLYGPGCRTLSTLIPNTIRRVQRGDPPIVKGGGLMKRDFLFIDDAVSAYRLLLLSDATGAFNFGTGEPRMVKDVVKLLLKLMKSKLKPVGLADFVGEIAHQWTRSDRARKLLGWVPRTSFEEGLKRTIAWHVGPVVDKWTTSTSTGVMDPVQAVLQTWNANR